jgi:hypothetical protein
MSLADLMLIYARAFVYLLAIGALLFSPSAPDLFRASQLSIAIAVSTLYVPLAVFLEAKGVTKVSPKVNKTLYVVDMTLLCWVVGSSGGITSPIYPFLFLPVIFIAFRPWNKGCFDFLNLCFFCRLRSSSNVPTSKFHIIY